MNIDDLFTFFDALDPEARELDKLAENINPGMRWQRYGGRSLRHPKGGWPVRRDGATVASKAKDSSHDHT